MRVIIYDYGTSGFGVAWNKYIPSHFPCLAQLHLSICKEEEASEFYFTDYFFCSTSYHTYLLWLVIKFHLVYLTATRQKHYSMHQQPIKLVEFHSKKDSHPLFTEELHQKRKQVSHYFTTKSTYWVLSLNRKLKVGNWDIQKYLLLKTNSIESYDARQHSVTNEGLVGYRYLLQVSFHLSSLVLSLYIGFPVQDCSFSLND